MVEPESKAQLLEALQALYHHPDATVRKQADRWLENWQKGTAAWSVADNVLHDSAATMEAQYFCAQTLRTKVQRDFEELPSDAADSLRGSLIALLLRFSRGAPPVRTQLCLALAAIPPHMAAGSWGEGGVINWLAQRLGQDQSGAGGMSCLLEMLTVIPQEAGTFRDAIRPERRREYKAELVAAAPTALNLLTACLQKQGSSDHHHREIMEAFGSWLRLGGGAGMDGAMLCQHPLVLAALSGLESTDNLDAAVDAVCELVWCTVGPAPSSDGGPGQPLPHMVPLVQLLVSKVFSLRPRFSVAAARARNEKVAEEHEHWDDDEDTAKDMARVFAEMAEAFVGTIVQASPEVAALVEAMLDVAGYPEDSIAAISFNFWHSLAMALRGRGAGAGVDDAERERRRQAFVPAFEKLVVLIRGRVRFPDGHETMRREERNEFKRARYAVADTLEDAAMVVGGGRILELMVEPLQAMSAALSSGGGAFDWRTVEAALYCIRAVHKAVPAGAHPVMQQLMVMLPQLPSLPGCSPQLLYTAALMVGAYSEWLLTALYDCVPKSSLAHLLALLHAALLHEESAAAGALSLRHICDSCRSHLVDEAGDLKRLYELVVPLGVVQEATANSQLKLEDEDVGQIVEAVTQVMAASPADQLSAALDSLLGPITSLLEACCAQLPPGATVKPLLPLVDRLTIVLRSFQDSGGCDPMNHASLIAKALGQYWPLVETLMEKARGDQSAMEAVCKAPRYALRSAGKAAAPLLPLLLDRLPQHFKTTRQCTILYVASELVKTFGDDTSNTDAVGILFQSMLQEALPLLSSLEGFTADPFIADDTFLLVGRAISYCPSYIYKDHAITSALLDTALNGLLVQQREASMSVLAFFTKLLDVSAIQRAESRGCQQAAANLQAAVMGGRDGRPDAPSRGSEVVRLMLAGIVGVLPRSRVCDVSDALLAVLQATQGQGMQWLMDCLNRLPEAVAAHGDKERFWRDVKQAANSGLDSGGSRLMEDAVIELSDLCRRNQRALEAAQAALMT